MVKTIKWKKTNRENGKETCMSRGRAMVAIYKRRKQKARAMGVIIGLHYTWIGGV